MRRPRLALAAGLTLLLAACAAAANLTDPRGPRFAGAGAAAPPAGPVRELRVVTFNIAYGRHVDRAIRLFRTEPALQHADLIALQEMTDTGTAQFAHALGLNYAYYPAAVHPRTHAYFGNAILSPWPLEADRKLILPRLGSLRGMQRIAVGATIRIGDRRIRVYSVHLANAGDVGREGQRDQIRAILRDADASRQAVVIAGDMNGHDVGALFAAQGYLWPTKALGGTFWKFDVDHVFVRGLAAVDRARAGLAEDRFDASDHRPVWVSAELSAD